MIEVEVRLYATLRKYRPRVKLGEGIMLKLAEETTVQRLLEGGLGIPPDEVKIVFVNAVSRKPDQILADGDRVAIFPPIAGG